MPQSKPLQKLYRLFWEYNRKFWGGKLPRPIIEIVDTRDFAGQCSLGYRVYPDGTSKPEYLIELSKSYLNNRDFTKTTLLHEMVHVATTAKEVAAHGPVFYKELRRLMRAGAFDKLL